MTAVAAPRPVTPRKCRRVTEPRDSAELIQESGGADGLAVCVSGHRRPPWLPLFCLPVVRQRKGGTVRPASAPPSSPGANAGGRFGRARHQRQEIAQMRSVRRDIRCARPGRSGSARARPARLSARRRPRRTISGRTASTAGIAHAQAGCRRRTSGPQSRARCARSQPYPHLRRLTLPARKFDLPTKSATQALTGAS